MQWNDDNAVEANDDNAVEALLTDALVSGQLYLQPHSQNPVSTPILFQTVCAHSELRLN